MYATPIIDIMICHHTRASGAKTNNSRMSRAVVLLGVLSALYGSQVSTH